MKSRISCALVCAMGLAVTAHSEELVLTPVMARNCRVLAGDIYANGQSLELQARVTACHMGSGMGLMFEHLTAEQNFVLLRWLEGSPDRDESPFRTAPAANAAADGPNANARFAAKLVQILERKGILTRSESAELLRDIDS